MNHVKKISFSFLWLVVFLLPSQAQQKINAQTKPLAGRVWTTEKANAWYNKHTWITGANFIPSTAINQLEMWQAETFDPETIDRELGFAQNIGFNTMRVFLHSVAWKQDATGFKKRMDQYLTIADKHKIQTMFVFFDDCWNKDPKPGLQPAPKPGVHNSGWMQDPGDPYAADSTVFPSLEKYVKDVMKHFAHDKRILLWDLYNEPGNSGKKETSLPLLKKVFQWARSVNPDQPLSAGLWAWDFKALNNFQAASSDVVTYHDYEDSTWHQRVIELLKTHGRPLICTEYMARSRKSNFANILPLLKKQQVGGINWGLLLAKLIRFMPGIHPYPPVKNQKYGSTIYLEKMERHTVRRK